MIRHRLQPSEAQVHDAVVAHLRLRAKPDVLWLHVPNGGARDAKTGAILKRMSTALAVDGAGCNVKAAPAFCLGRASPLRELRRLIAGGRLWSHQRREGTRNAAKCGAFSDGAASEPYYAQYPRQIWTKALNSTGRIALARSSACATSL